jgi:hypothetical protein
VIVNRLSADDDDSMESGKIIQPDHSHDRGSVTLSLSEAIEVEGEGSLAALDLYRGLHAFSIAEGN